LPVSDDAPPAALRQWAILSGRAVRLLTTDRQNVALLLAQPLGMAALICLVYRDLPSILFLVVLATLWFGCSTACQQIVKERAVYRRERMVNLARGAHTPSARSPGRPQPSPGSVPSSSG